MPGVPQVAMTGQPAAHRVKYHLTHIKGSCKPPCNVGTHIFVCFFFFNNNALLTDVNCHNESKHQNRVFYTMSKSGIFVQTCSLICKRDWSTCFFWNDSGPTTSTLLVVAIVFSLSLCLFVISFVVVLMSTSSSHLWMKDCQAFCNALCSVVSEGSGRSCLAREV